MFERSSPQRYSEAPFGANRRPPPGAWRGRPGGAVVSYIVFLVLGTAMIAGLIGGHEAGLTNWTIGEAHFVKVWSGTFSVLMAAGFAFVGVESA